MARKISNPDEGWRTRTSSGEYELDLEELRDWIVEGKVKRETHVRPPVTRRWKRAENCIELRDVFEAQDQVKRDLDRAARLALWEAGRPERERRQRRHRILVWSGFILLILVPAIGLYSEFFWLVLGFPVGFLLLVIAAFTHRP